LTKFITNFIIVQSKKLWTDFLSFIKGLR